MKRNMLWLAIALVAGCATEPVVSPAKPAFDFFKVRRISVMPFDGPGGSAATDEFVRQLVLTGIEVTDATHAGDVVLKGVVTEYKPNVQLMVTLGGDFAMVTSASQQMPEAAVVAAHKTQVATVISQVSVQVHLDEAGTRHAVWADSYAYEGSDLPTTLSAVVSSLARSMKRTFPHMNKPKAS